MNEIDTHVEPRHAVGQRALESPTVRVLRPVKRRLTLRGFYCDRSVLRVLAARDFKAAALIAGLAILDTTLVSVSRRRGGRPLLSGGRDHLTHRLLGRLGSPGRVALALGGAQLALCAVAVACALSGSPWVLAAGVVVVCAGVGTVAILESPRWFAPNATPQAPGPQSPSPTAPELTDADRQEPARARKLECVVGNTVEEDGATVVLVR